MRKTFVRFGLSICLASCIWASHSYAGEGRAETGGQPGANIPSPDAALRASCQNNLKQMGVVFKMFAYESKGQAWPCLSQKAGKLIFENKGQDADSVYPEYLTDLSILICPAAKDADQLKSKLKPTDANSPIDESSYLYLGYAIRNEDEMKAFVEAYKDSIAKGQTFDKDLTLADGKKLYRLSEGVERHLAEDAGSESSSDGVQSKIPVLIERLGNHNPEGGNVLYMDGHVEFIKFGTNGKWPMTPEFFEAVKSMMEVKAPK